MQILWGDFGLTQPNAKTSSSTKPANILLSSERLSSNISPSPINNIALAEFMARQSLHMRLGNPCNTSCGYFSGRNIRRHYNWSAML